MHSFIKIYRMYILSNVSVYYIILIGVPHFFICLIDYCNKDALNIAVYCSLIAKQTLLVRQYLLFPTAIIVCEGVSH